MSDAAPSVCRFCAAPLERIFCDLGMSPLANSYLAKDELNAAEAFYPLRALVCSQCFLVQLDQYESPSHIFSDYAYFSSYSSTWLEHSKRYADQMVERLGLDEASMVVEIASNDGYLLQYFHERQIPVLGIEPAANVARVALQHGIPTLVEFFGTEVADQLVKESAADLLIGNNVLAHVPDLNDFVRGMRRLLKPSGVITMEFPHLQHLVDGGHFDTIYHEHFSYFSWSTAARVFAAHGMELFDVEELPTHGGSIRIFGHHADDTTHAVTDRAREMSDREAAAGYGDLALYESFDASVRAQKRDIMRLFIEAKERGDRIAGYGAPAKGNTLLNYCGIGSDFIDFTVDINPNKQDFYLPGTHIPVLAPEEIRRQRPDVVFILPWNLTDEIVAEHGYVREWGGEFAARWPAVARF